MRAIDINNFMCLYLIVLCNFWRSAAYTDFLVVAGWRGRGPEGRSADLELFLGSCHRETGLRLAFNTFNVHFKSH
jgi:hypothetical protein